MECVTLPVPMLDCDEYRGLASREKQFLIDLYICFGDCETFTIDAERPQEYRQRHCDAATIYRKLRALISAGLVSISYQPNGKQGRPTTVYSFKYQVPYVLNA